MLGAGIILAGGAAAQPALQPGASGQQGAADDLSRNLRMLANNPRSLSALMGAGRASLEVGDAQAALTFFARAEEIAPNDGRIKMWIGTALVQLEQPRPALRFLNEAVAMGVAEAEIAGNRGLVYDMLGDPRRAQREYELALRRAADPEITRRLALSLAISGERERALQLLEGQLLVRDRAAARTRALVLALTGDTAGASRAAQAAMPGAQAAAMEPFFARLPSLTPSERALAVHFGHFPGSGAAPSPTAGLYASIDPATAAGAPDGGQPALGGRLVLAPEQVSSAPRRRPDASDAATAPGARAMGPVDRSVGVTRPSTAPVDQRASIVARQTGRQPPATAPVASEPAVRAPAPALTTSEPVTLTPAPVQSQDPAQGPAQGSTTLSATSEPAALAPARSLVPAQSTATVPSRATTAGGRLADVAATIASLSDSAAVKPAPPVVRAPPAAARQAKAKPTPAPARKAVPAPPRDPSRVWVQIAGGANKSSLPREYGRLKSKAPRLLGARPAWTTPANATNRLLVGPFASSREAQAFVNDLAKLDVAGFAWTSAAGQKVERLPAR